MSPCPKQVSCTASNAGETSGCEPTTGDSRRGCCRRDTASGRWTPEAPPATQGPAKPAPRCRDPGCPEPGQPLLVNLCPALNGRRFQQQRAQQVARPEPHPRRSQTRFCRHANARVACPRICGHSQALPNTQACSHIAGDDQQLTTFRSTLRPLPLRCHEAAKVSSEPGAPLCSSVGQAPPAPPAQKRGLGRRVPPGPSWLCHDGSWAVALLQRESRQQLLRLQAQGKLAGSLVTSRPAPRSGSKPRPSFSLSSTCGRGEVSPPKQAL